MNGEAILNNWWNTIVIKTIKIIISKVKFVIPIIIPVLYTILLSGFAYVVYIIPLNFQLVKKYDRTYVFYNKIFTKIDRIFIIIFYSTETLRLLSILGTYDRIILKVWPDVSHQFLHCAKKRDKLARCLQYDNIVNCREVRSYALCIVRTHCIA